MKVEKVVKEDNTKKLEKIIESLQKDEMQIGIFGEDDSFILMVATVHEFGTNIKPKTSKYLTVPCNPKSKDKKARDFEDLWTLKDKKGQLWLVRNKGKNELEFMYMLARQVNIPERSFLRGAFDNNSNKINRFIENNLDKLLTFRIGLNQFYNLVGEYIVSIIKKYMTDLKEPPKSPITLSSNPNKENPLIDTGRLRQSVVWKVKRR